MRKRLTLTILTAILVASLLPGAASGQSLNIDMGVTDRTWLSRSAPGTDLVIFAWIPVMSMFDAELFLIGECYRVDSLGELVGKHRVIFKNITLVGVDSENTVEATRSSQRIKNGLQKKQAVWGLTDAARTLFAEDSSILVAGEITVTKRVDAWDVLTCGLGVVEVIDVATSSSSIGAGGFEGALMPAYGAEVPRLLRKPNSTE